MAEACKSSIVPVVPTNAIHFPTPRLRRFLAWAGLAAWLSLLTGLRAEIVLPPLHAPGTKQRPVEKSAKNAKAPATKTKTAAKLPKVTKPNVVIILTDDLGINDLHCYGRTEHRTPRLDRLAAEGMRFTSAYCAQPICSASRAALLTGKSPARLHLTTFLPGREDCPAQKLLHPAIAKELPLEEKTFAEYFKEAGYKTAFFGKWHLGGYGFEPNNQGFDEFDPGLSTTPATSQEGGKGEYGLTAKAERFLERNHKTPFLLVLSHNYPHIPYTAKPALVARNSEAFEPVYAGLIETLDDSVGRLLSTMDSLGLHNNTLVIFTSDNGGLHVPELKHVRVTHNTPYRAGKGFLYEGGLRIPLIARFPGVIPANRTNDAVFMNTDWTPTLLNFAGIKPVKGAELDGVDRSEVLRGKTTKSSAPSFWHFPHYTNQGGRPAGAMREGEWKLIEHYETGTHELYNLTKDPGERDDRAAAETSRVSKLATSLQRWRQTVGAQTNAPNPAFVPAQHVPLYEAVDVSKFEPAKADRQEMSRILAWRKEMDEAAKRPNVPPVPAP